MADMAGSIGLGILPCLTPSGGNFREKDMRHPIPSLPERLYRHRRRGHAGDRPRHRLPARPPDRTPFAQQGPVDLRGAGRDWWSSPTMAIGIVPPTRAIWMPAGFVHSIRCVGELHMRSLWVRPDAAPHLPAVSQAVGVFRPVAGTDPVGDEAGCQLPARLARRPPGEPDPDELQALPVLALHLPQPADPALQRICSRLLAQPDDGATLGQWGGSCPST